MSRSKVWRFLALAWLAQMASLPCAALAQSAIENAARGARQFDSLQAEQQRQRQLEELQRSNRAPLGEPPVRPVPQTSAKGERCFNIKTITVEGAHLVADAMIRNTVSAWEGRCLGLAEINSVLKALTFLYVDRGYIASRAYLREQDLRKGELAIAIVEGKLEDIRLNGQSDDRRVIGSAFPGMVGQPVNLRDIEQGLDQSNRLSSNNATTSLSAGSQQGYSVLDVANKPDSRFHFTLGADNLGATVSGIYQSRIGMVVDNLFGANDLWQFGYQRSNDRSPGYLSRQRPNSDTVNASMSIPYGYWTAGVDSVWSAYHSSVPGQNSVVETAGSSLLVAPYLTRVIHRDQVSKTSATARLTWKNTENDILGTRIDVASRVLSIASFELNHSRRLLGGQASASLGYHHGLAILGAFNDATAPLGSPKGEFSKITASLGYMHPFDLGAVTPILSTYLLGQWTPDRLFGTEQMPFGGYSTVRGVRDAILFADNGALARNEFSLMLPAPEHAGAARVIGRIEPYVAVDVGYAAPTQGYFNANGVLIGDDGGRLVGVAAGLRNRGGRLSLDVWYATLVDKPDMPAAALPPTSLVQGRLSIAF